MGSVLMQSSSKATWDVQLAPTNVEKRHNTKKHTWGESNSGKLLFCCWHRMCCYHSWGQSSPCWLGPSPDWTVLIHRRNAKQQCPPAASPWIPALHCIQPATWPASPHTPAETAEQIINHRLFIQCMLKVEVINCCVGLVHVCLFNLFLPFFSGGGLWPWGHSRGWLRKLTSQQSCILNKSVFFYSTGN